MDNSALLYLLVILIICYTLLYFTRFKYLEQFQDSQDSFANNQHNRHNRDNQHNNRNTPNTSNHKHISPENPYAMNTIDSVDDYEVSAVYHNQGSREASKKEINDAMTRYPLDWSAQGHGSQYFQENKEIFLKKQHNIPQPESYYKDTNTDMLLPDHSSLDEEERKILQTYKPESSKGLLQYSVDDVTGLLTKIYDKKGLIPIIEKSKQGENIWEIIEVKEKNPKITWEDETETIIQEHNEQRERMDKRGEDMISIPYTASDVAAGLDPFFQASPSTRIAKTDYTSFTPGLERMFAPTYPVKSWF